MSSKALRNFLAAQAEVKSYTMLEANSELVESTLEKVASTYRIIERLAQDGKAFDHVSAKIDLLNVVDRMTKIAEDTDMASEWVSADLGTLLKRASELRKIFPESF